MITATLNTIAMGQKSKMTVHNLCQTPIEVSLSGEQGNLRSVAQIAMGVVLQIRYKARSRSAAARR